MIPIPPSHPCQSPWSLPKWPSFATRKIPIQSVKKEPTKVHSFTKSLLFFCFLFIKPLYVSHIKRVSKLSHQSLKLSPHGKVSAQTSFLASSVQYKSKIFLSVICSTPSLSFSYSITSPLYPPSSKTLQKIGRNFEMYSFTTFNDRHCTTRHALLFQ